MVDAPLAGIVVRFVLPRSVRFPPVTSMQTGPRNSRLGKVVTRWLGGVTERRTRSSSVRNTMPPTNSMFIFTMRHGFGIRGGHGPVRLVASGINGRLPDPVCGRTWPIAIIREIVSAVGIQAFANSPWAMVPCGLFHTRHRPWGTRHPVVFCSDCRTFPMARSFRCRRMSLGGFIC